MIPLADSSSALTAQRPLQDSSGFKELGHTYLPLTLGKKALPRIPYTLGIDRIREECVLFPSPRGADSFSHPPLLSEKPHVFLQAKWKPHAAAAHILLKVRNRLT